jgi:glycine/sarcosine N-methyltransferase
MGTGYRDLAAHYSLLFPLNDRQRGFFEHLVGSGPVDSILDVGCGTGEHLSWFSARGLRSYGLEPDETMFRELKLRRWPGTVPTLLPAGVETLPGAIGEKADLVLCLGNTLPHLPDRAAARQAVRRMADTLSPRGHLVIQTVNFDRILEEGSVSFPVIERTLPDGGRVSFFREYDLDALPERLLFRTLLVTPKGEQRGAWPLVPLRRDEMAQFLCAAGLPAMQAFGDYDRRPFAGNSPALILLAQREEPAKKE